MFIDMIVSPKLQKHYLDICKARFELKTKLAYFKPRQMWLAVEQIKKENTLESGYSMFVVIKAVVQIYWCRSFNCNTVEW